MFRKIIMALLTSLAVLGLSACDRSPVVRLYDGPKKPKSELAVVRVPMELEVLTVNDRRVENINTLFSIGYKDLHLKPGRYRILAYYKDLWELPGDSHEVVESDPALFVVDGKAGHFYKLGYPQPNDIDQAHQLAKRFDGWVEDVTSGERTDSKPSGLVLQHGLGSSVRDMAGGPATTAQASEQAAGNNEAIAPEPTAEEKASDMGEGGYLDMLKASWNQATQEERRDFLKWVGQQQ